MIFIFNQSIVERCDCCNLISRLLTGKGQFMQEYRIEDDLPNKIREAKRRFISWGAVLFFAIIAIIVFRMSRSDVSRGVSSSVEIVFLLSVFGAIIAFNVAAYREALYYAARKMVFVLDSNGITRKRIGYPEVKIALTEIDTLIEGSRWLIIKSAQPRRIITIPHDVREYDALRTELARHHSIELRTMFPWKCLLLFSVSVLSWTAILISQNAGMAIAATVIVLIALVFASHRLMKVFVRGSGRLLLWIFLVITWLMAFILIYLYVIPLM